MRRIVGVEATGINACPCAQGLVRGQASERLLEAGFDDGDVERILELVPLATHNQRGRGTLYVGSDQPVNAEQLAAIVEGSMSSPIYELLKRPDELFVVEHAHLQPRFVEDSVRISLRSALERYRSSTTPTFLLARQLNFETIHSHDVVAERYGTVGELRARARERRPAARTHRATRVARRYRRWNRKRLSVPERSRAMFARCSTTTATAAAAAKTITGHGLAEQRGDDRQRQRPRASRRARRSGRAGTRRARPRRRSPPTTGATPRNAPPHVATTLPPRCHLRNSGRQCPSIAAPPASTPARCETTSVATSAGTNPFAVSSTTTGSPSRQP